MKPIYKILIAIGAILVLGAAGYFIWWLFVDEAGTGIDLPNGTVPGGNGVLPSSTSTEAAGEAEFSTPRAISDHAAFDYWLVPETGETYYLTPEGYVYAVKEGPDLEISKQTISALNHAEPSLDGRRLLVSFGNPASPQWGIFDTADSVWRPLPSQIANAGWGRTANELVASVASGNDLNLSFVDISRTPPVYTVLVRNFRMESVTLSMLGNGDILIAERPSARFEGSAWRLNPATRALTLTLSPSAGRMVKLERSTGVSYLYGAGAFAIANGVFQNAFPLFFRTFPDKCASVASTTYCFVPRDLPANLSFPDDYLMRGFYSADSLYSVRHPSFAISPLVIGEGVYDASRVRADENAVYFLDRYTSKLYELTLPSL